MKLYSIHAGYFKLDGGAMFGVVPKKIWQKLVPADDNNLCTWAMRCLLVDTGERKILIDCGMGNKQNEKFMSHYEPHGPTLEKSLASHGFQPEDITDLFLTHLHFDHCGGAVNRNGDGKLVPAFPHAKVWTNKKHWDWAIKPNDREKASFLEENLLPLEEHGVLHFLEEGASLCPEVDTIWVDGHTEAMMLPVIKMTDKTLVYMADLLPASAHIPLPYIMGYDIRPLITLEEKKAFLQTALENDYYLFFEHDAVHECCNLRKTDRGIRPLEFFPLTAL